MNFTYSDTFYYIEFDLCTRSTPMDFFNHTGQAQSIYGEHSLSIPPAILALKPTQNFFDGCRILL